jgi:hypothetical protein
MTTWLERREKIQQHAAHIARRQLGDPPEAHTPVSLSPPHIQHGRLKMARNATLKKVSFQTIACEYGAITFQDALADFIARVNHPGVTTATLRNHSHNTFIPFNEVPVYHKIKFTANVNSERSEVIDSVQVHPEHTNDRGRIISKRFDTVLVSGAQSGTEPNKGKRNYIADDLIQAY